jgi:hypothetical protein
MSLPLFGYIFEGAVGLFLVGLVILACLPEEDR